MTQRKGVRSARGEMVDFDLMKIKQQIAAAPKPTNVTARESFIDQKFRRKLNKERLKKVAAEAVTGVSVDPELPTTSPEETEEE